MVVIIRILWNCSYPLSGRWHFYYHFPEGTLNICPRFDWLLKEKLVFSKPGKYILTLLCSLWVTMCPFDDVYNIKKLKRNVLALFRRYPKDLHCNSATRDMCQPCICTREPLCLDTAALNDNSSARLPTWLLMLNNVRRIWQPGASL